MLESIIMVSASGFLVGLFFGIVRSGIARRAA